MSEREREEWRERERHELLPHSWEHCSTLAPKPTCLRDKDCRTKDRVIESEREREKESEARSLRVM